jgi:DNA-binding winged helix-turn-helix (wHTH) protein/TolB-like protein
VTLAAPEEPQAGPWFFDGFALDAGRRTLSQGGADVELRAKGLDLLICLVRHAGQVVTKDELMAAVWPDVVVSDESITRCVSDIRQALSDADQRIVKTVPRRGYVLVAPVSVAPAPRPSGSGAEAGVQMPSGPATGPSAPVAAAPDRRKLLPLAAWGAIVAVLALAACGWAWWHQAQGPGAALAQRSGDALPLSIAVLPLARGDEEADLARFAEGLTHDLTTDLARIPDSHVVGRGLAGQVKIDGKPIDSRAIGRELGVRYILEGSVQRLNELMRLNLRLVDADTGAELWSEIMDGDRSDLAALQLRVAGSVAWTLHLEMMAAEAQRSLKLRPDNPAAQDLVWQGYAAMERRTPRDLESARGLLQRAVALDAGNAFAWSGLAQTYANDLASRWLHHRGASADEWLRRGHEAADKALAIDPDNLYALAAQSRLWLYGGQPAQSLAMAQRVVAINRNYAPGWFVISCSLMTLGQPNEAIAAGLRANALTLRDGRASGILTVIAAAHFYAGRDTEALAWARRSLAAKPGYAISHAYVAAASASLGDMATARSAIAEFKRLQPDYSISTFRAEQHGNNADFLRQRDRLYRNLLKAGLAE